MQADPSGARLAAGAFSRRGFLVRSAGLAAALTCGGVAGCGGAGEYRALTGGELPATLAVREYAILRALAARMVPGSPTHPGASSLHVAARVDRELAFHSERLRRDVADALRLVEWWPLATRFARFTRLAPDAQDAELTAHAASRHAFRRSALQGLKFLVMFFHYSQDEAWIGTGYDGPWVPRVEPAALA